MRPSERGFFSMGNVKLPKSIRIGAHTIAVRFAGAREMEDGGAYGHFSPLKMEIAVREDLAPSLQWATFMHEVIEAIGHFYQLKLEEYQIDVLSEGICQALGLTGQDRANHGG